MIIRNLTTALIVTCLVCACSKPNTEYFPLGNKGWWQYSIKRKIKGELKTQKLIVANMKPAKNAQGDTIYPRKRMDERIEIFKKQEDGIYRINSKDSRQIKILPAALEKNSSWQEDTRILFLESTGAFSAAFEQKVKQYITMDYVIEDFADKVTVPAGNFRNCMRVKSTGKMFGGQTLKTYLGIRFIQIEQTDWYAPGVGLVKRVRNEFTTPPVFTNEYIEELEKFENR